VSNDISTDVVEFEVIFVLHFYQRS